MQPWLLNSKVVQVHPTQRCNLACSHCYSSSGPGNRTEIEPERLVTCLQRLRREGYEVVSFSGGEPLIYRGLNFVASQAKAMGYRVNLITNGLLLSSERLERLADSISLLGISLDGSQERHDRMRGMKGAFRKVEARLPELRESGIAFGFSHCVTKKSIEDLPWLVDFALAQGAKLLQLHPLTMIGRASQACDSLGLSEADLARVFIIVELLRIQVEGELAIQLDILSGPQIEAMKRRFTQLLKENSDASGDIPMSQLVNPIVLDEKGDLWPMAYGMSDAVSITRNANCEWDKALDRYKASRAETLRNLLELTITLLDGAQPRFLDFYGFLVACSHDSKLIDLGQPLQRTLPSPLFPNPADIRPNPAPR